MSDQRDAQMNDKSSTKVKDLPDYYSTKTDMAFKALIDEANNGTKVSARTLFQALELKEQIVSLRIQAATQGLANTIAYYFEQIEDILDKETKAQHTIANDPTTPKQIRTFLKTIDKLRSYNQGVIMYCYTDQHLMVNTNTIRFKTPWNFSKTSHTTSSSS
ncbi:hypothetical protein OXYTRIMIC_448 [Oxytricha trifallax]|uniref:Uncharacterized protein n=1 Tax=Oxytricha trifallax TaxID=1172189 RepID=A0A073IB22_9SPIT|nr:hypothetical protein OXYTRIMIC_448 [Oxytricha trifallax]